MGKWHLPSSFTTALPSIYNRHLYYNFAFSYHPAESGGFRVNKAFESTIRGEISAGPVVSPLFLSFIIVIALLQIIFILSLLNYKISNGIVIIHLYIKNLPPPSMAFSLSSIVLPWRSAITLGSGIRLKLRNTSVDRGLTPLFLSSLLLLIALLQNFYSYHFPATVTKKLVFVFILWLEKPYFGLTTGQKKLN